MNRIVITFILCWSVISTVAQTTGIDKTFRPRESENKAQLLDYISFMNDKSKSFKTREYYLSKALELFEGRGKAYIIHGDTCKGVKVEVTSEDTDITKVFYVGDFLGSWY